VRGRRGFCYAAAMLAGVERFVDLLGARQSGLSGVTLPDLQSAVTRGDAHALSAGDGHFAACGREGNVVRLARTIGVPLRYFVAKMYHGPFLVTSDRVDAIFEWCVAQRVGWQFDPSYTRMVPAHHLVEIEQVGCPDPSPRLTRFFTPADAAGSEDLDELGAAYASAALGALDAWLAAVPEGEPIGVAYSGGLDSASTFVLARHALSRAGRDPNVLRAFTLDLGGGADARQAREALAAVGCEDGHEVVAAPAESLDLEDAIRTIEDYHPLDVECAAVALRLFAGVRERYPSLRYLLDGDGGDENLKSYPLEDSDLTTSSVLRNPLLYHEGWGVDALKHSAVYSGGLSRSYTRTYAPARRFGFEAFSPYTSRAAIASAVAIPFERLIGGSPERLYALKAEVVRRGVRAATGLDIPAFPKRRFQEGAGGAAYARWRVGKAWCRRVFLGQWEERLRVAWDAERRSGNDETGAPAIAFS
jgi:asparagine synthase (glutamine-hydrolysing)